MNDSNPSSSNARPDRPAWNKGKLTGPKPPSSVMNSRRFN
jgi:hypothetical protein